MAVTVVGIDAHGKKIRYQVYDDPSDAREHLVALKKTYPKMKFGLEPTNQKGTTLQKAVALAEAAFQERRDAGFGRV